MALLPSALRRHVVVLWLHTETWSHAGGPRPPLFPAVIDRWVNPREAKGNNKKMHLITLFSLLQAFLPHVWHVSEITLHVWKGLEMILTLVLACSSYRLVECIDKHHAVIRAYCARELNYELSLQRFTSDTTPSARLTVKMCKECNNDTWCAPYEPLYWQHMGGMSLWPCWHQNQISKHQLHKRLPAFHSASYNFSSNQRM